MMRSSRLVVVLAPNAWKECMSAHEAAAAMRQGVLRADASAEIREVPLGDGGDGTLDLIVKHKRGQIHEMMVDDPIFRKVSARFGLVDGGNTAIIEMANPSGMWRLKKEEQNCMVTTSLGFGQLMRQALDLGVQNMLLCIGGSATNDGGIGVAVALGYQIFDSGSVNGTRRPITVADGKAVAPVGGKLGAIARIDSSLVHSRLRAVNIQVACDVSNPLLGPLGATAIYGPQKGLPAGGRQILEDGLSNLVRLWSGAPFNAAQVAELPGAGAAGGMGAGLMAFCGAQLKPGFALVADMCGFQESLNGAHLCLTSEGRIDGQTASGKVPWGVATYSKRADVSSVAICGGAIGDMLALHEAGLDAVFSIAPGPITLQESVMRAPELLAVRTEQAVRLWLAGKRARL